MPDVDELKSRARRAEAAGDYRLALESYQEALERERETTDPDMMDPALRLRVADLHFRLGDPDRALDVYLRASKLYARQGLIPNAIAVCNKVLGEYPDHIESHRILADLQLKIGLTADARANLLRYVEEAAGRDRTAAARDAARAYLEEEPDQDVAVAVAKMLAGDGRTDRAMEILREVWEERTGLRQPAGRIESVARELDPDADLSEWTPVWPPPRTGRSESAEEAVQPSPEAVEPPGEAVESTAGVAEAPDTAAVLDERPAEADPGEPPPASPSRHNGARTPETEEPAASGEGPAASASGEGPAASVPEPRPSVASEIRPTATSEPTPTATSEPTPAATSEPTPAATSEPTSTGTPQSTPTAVPEPSASSGGAAFDRERELRQGLELVEEMLEVAPDHLELHRRRVLYSRGLGDLQLLERALVELGEVLLDRGSHRGARFVFEEVREQLNPGSALASEGLRRLNRQEGAPGERVFSAETAGRTPSSAASAATSDATSSVPSSVPGSTPPEPKESDVDRHFRRRLREALSASSRELSWLHAAAEGCGSERSGAVPGSSHELMGRYLLMRDRPEEAVEHLQAALDRSPAEGERPAELLYHLGRAWRRAREPARARDCFERLAGVDPDFRAAWAVVSPDGG